MGSVLLLGVVVVVVLLTRRQWRGAAAARRPRAGFEPSSYGLVASAELDPGRAGPPMRLLRRKELEALADSCLAGGWRAAAAHVTAAGTDWNARWYRLDFLTRVAAERDEWLTDWRRSGVERCAAETVRARLLVQRAWKVCGAGFAEQTPAERTAAFRGHLAEAFRVAEQAAELDPHDPGPWVVLVTAARGMRVSRRRFQELWAELARRAPHHVVGHWQAMQYWCAKWHGSDRLMLRFVREATAAAPAGSLLPGLYLQALGELEQRHGPYGLPAARRMRAPLERVATALADQDPVNDQVPLLRHLLAYYSLRAGLPGLALEQFRLIGPWCGAPPWTSAADPVRAFDIARATAAAQVSAQAAARTG